MVCGWQSARDEEAPPLAAGDLVQHVHRLGGGRASSSSEALAIVKRRQVGDHRLEVEQRLEPALGDLGLVGRVLRVPAGILEDVALDDRRRDRSRSSPCR